FKGGVGRTMALVNIGAALAANGKRVLLVDFDLEAPGLDTFDLPKSKEPVPGLVEFVSEYLATDSAPDARLFIYESAGVGKGGGHLWIMPSGRRDATYEHRLAAIDWQSLYRDRDGYLLFEDLKAQWRAELVPDYVLIDSRTGHTETLGICTRQLPD